MSETDQNHNWKYSLKKTDEFISDELYVENKIFQDLMTLIAFSGNGEPWIILSLVFLYFDVFLSRLQNLIQILTIIIILILVGIIKYVIKRKRPDQKLATEYISKGDHYSFPSGHAGRAMGFAVLIWFFYPSFGWIFLIWGLMISYSRIALKLHYLTDVIAGMLLGTLIAGLSILGYRYLEKIFSPLIQLLNKIFW